MIYSGGNRPLPSRRPRFRRNEASSGLHRRRSRPHNSQPVLSCVPNTKVRLFVCELAVCDWRRTSGQNVPRLAANPGLHSESFVVAYRAPPLIPSVAQDPLLPCALVGIMPTPRYCCPPVTMYGASLPPVRQSSLSMAFQQPQPGLPKRESEDPFSIKAGRLQGRGGATTAAPPSTSHRRWRCGLAFSKPPLRWLVAGKNAPAGDARGQRERCASQSRATVQ